MPWGEFFTYIVQGFIVMIVLFIAAALISGARDAIKGKKDK